MQRNRTRTWSLIACMAGLTWAGGRPPAQGQTKDQRAAERTGLTKLTADGQIGFTTPASVEPGVKKDESFGDDSDPAGAGGCAPDCGKLNIECLNPSPDYDNRTFVGRILNGGFGWCTGWIVATDGNESVIMTNQHCTLGQDVTNFTIRFNDECDACVGGSPKPTFSFPVTGLITQNAALDYALLRVGGDPAATWGVARIDPALCTVGMPIYEIHHAASIRKGYDVGTVLQCAVNACVNNEIAVSSIVASGGASGSPIFRSDNHCVTAICDCGPNCQDGFGVPMSNIIPNAEPILQAAGFEFVFCAARGACCDNSQPCGDCVDDVLESECVSGGGEGEDKDYEAANLNIEIPDADGDENAASHTITVLDSGIIADLDVGLQITHTWTGDLCVTVAHGGTEVSIIARPGIVEGPCDGTSCCGCMEDNYAGIILDDEGLGGTIEDQCTTDLNSPPNYTPNEPLSAFDGMEKQGAWTITVSDNADADEGTLDGWSLHVLNEGEGGSEFFPDMTCLEVEEAGMCGPLVEPVSSDPPDGAIDAGHPSSLDLLCADEPGWESIDITFDGDASCVQCSDFTITVCRPNVDPPNCIDVVSDGNTATLVLDTRIPLQHWTIFTHNATGWSTWLGYLPADVNGDGTSGPVDILDLIDFLNGLPPPFEIWQCDVNRTTECNSADILGVIDLLNGADCWDPWNGATLPDCR